MNYEVGKAYKIKTSNNLGDVFLDMSYSRTFHTQKTEIIILVLEKLNFIPLLPVDYYDRYGNDSSIQWHKILYDNAIYYFSPHRYHHGSYQITELC